MHKNYLYLLFKIQIPSSHPEILIQGVQAGVWDLHVTIATLLRVMVVAARGYRSHWGKLALQAYDEAHSWRLLTPRREVH